MSNGNGSLKGLNVYSIVSLSILLGGIPCSFLFWITLVQDQFGLIIPFTLLLLLILNTAFKIPSFIDLILLLVYLPKTKEPQNLKYRKRFIVYIIMTIVGGVVALFAEFLMLFFTHGNAVG